MLLLRPRSKPGNKRINASGVVALEEAIAARSSTVAGTGSACNDCAEPVATRTSEMIGTAVGLGDGDGVATARSTAKIS